MMGVRAATILLRVLSRVPLRTPLRVLSCALSCAGSSLAQASEIQTGREQQTGTIGTDATRADAGDRALKMFRQLRSDEIAGNLAALTAAAAADAGAGADADADAKHDDWAQRRAGLGRDAVIARNAAKSGAGARAAEEHIDQMRAALAAQIAADDPACARELVLECAEDLLLRMITADASDAMLAIGLPTPQEIARVRAVVLVARARLASELLAPACAPTADVATDAIVFRTRFLAGIAALCAADADECARRALDPALATGPDSTTGRGSATGPESATGRGSATGPDAATDTMRNDAARWLDDAARSELPVPQDISTMLALARARATSDPILRARLLGEARASTDAVGNYVARVESWRNARADGVAFPTAPSSNPALAFLAATAETRARMERNESAAQIAAPLERALRVAALARESKGDAIGSAAPNAFDSSNPRPSQPDERLQNMAASFALRMNTRLLEIAASDDCPPLLLALASMHPAGTHLRAQRRDALIAAARDPLIAPWLAVALARALQAQGLMVEAADVLVSMVETTDGLAVARDAMDIALVIRRAQAARDAAGEIALDYALSVAVRKIIDSPAEGVIFRDAWLLERVDLALFARWTLANPDRAAEILLGVSTVASMKDARAVRAIEIEGARVSSVAPSSKRDAAMKIAADAEIVGAQIDPAHGDLLARAQCLRAEMLVIAGRRADASTCAARAMTSTDIDPRTAMRAAAAWISANAAHDGAIQPPAALMALASTDAQVGELASAPLRAACDGVEAAIVEGNRANAAKLVRDQLAPWAQLASASTSAPTAELARAPILLALATGATTDAIERARLACAAWPDDRRLRWLLAESMRAGIADDARLRAQSFAIFRALAPMAAPIRDDVWWRAQLAQLEMLGLDATDTSANADEIIARINRLRAFDPQFSDKLLARRFDALRSKLEDANKRTRGKP